MNVPISIVEKNLERKTFKVMEERNARSITRDLQKDAGNKGED